MKTAAILAFAVVMAGCQVKAPPGTIDEAIHSADDVAATTQQVRLRMRALVEPLSGAIVRSSDRIRAEAVDADVRREALVWKIDAVPALRESLFRPNPFTAIMDTWVLTWQMVDYFETGPGREALGDAASIAAGTSRDLEGEIRRVAASLTGTGDVSQAGDFARDWAREHPIRHSIAGRESTLSRVAERDLVERLSPTALAGSVAVTLDDLTRRIDIYSAQLLEQARWQAELFAMDLAAGHGLERVLPLTEETLRATADTLDAVHGLLPAVEGALAVAESAPEVIAGERRAAVESAQAEIARMLRFVQDERLATLEHLTREREVVLLEVRQALAAERETVTTDVGRIGTDLVDHAVVRVAQLAGGILLAVFLGAIALLLIARRTLMPRPRTAD